MLIGHIEELEWPDTPERPLRVRIRHRANGHLYEVSVQANNVLLTGVPHSRTTGQGNVVVRLGRGRFVASLEHRTLLVRTHGPAGD